MNSGSLVTPARGDLAEIGRLGRTGARELRNGKRLGITRICCALRRDDEIKQKNVQYSICCVSMTFLIKFCWLILSVA